MVGAIKSHSSFCCKIIIKLNHQKKMGQMPIFQKHSTQEYQKYSTKRYKFTKLETLNHYSSNKKMVAGVGFEPTTFGL
jgi:hypothetical protein